MWSLHCLGASVVLHLKRLCVTADGKHQTHSPFERHSDEALLRDARSLFHTLEKNDHVDEGVGKLARQAGIIVDELDKISSARTNEESIPHILQRVANRVNSNHTLSSEAYPLSASMPSVAAPGDPYISHTDPSDLLSSIGLFSEQAMYDSTNIAVDWALFGFDAPIDGQG